MTSIQVGEKWLAHHGVLGQKWGVRHDPGHAGEKSKTKTIVKADQKFEKEISDIKTKNRVTPAFHNAFVRRVNARIDSLNDSPKYRNVDLSTYTGKLKEDYEKDSQEAILTSFEDATREIYGSNASGTKKGVYNRDTDQIDIVNKANDVIEHSVTTKATVPDVTVQLKRNSKTGLISSTTVVPYTNLILAHHGVLGMHWGHRKATAPRSDVQKAASKKRNDRIRNGIVLAGAVGLAAADPNSRRIISTASKGLLSDAAAKVAIRRGAKMAATILSDTRGLPVPTGPTVRLGLDIVTKTWKVAA